MQELLFMGMNWKSDGESLSLFHPKHYQHLLQVIWPLEVRRFVISTRFTFEVNKSNSTSFEFPSLIDRVALLSYLAHQDRQSLLSQIKILNWLDTSKFYLNSHYFPPLMIEIDSVKMLCLRIEILDRNTPFCCYYLSI